MFELKSKTLTEYYGKVPRNYDLKFLHYQIDLANLNPLELEFLSKDLDKIFEHIGKKYFKIYFSNLTTLKNVMKNTAIISKYQKFIYVKIRSEGEFLELKNDIKCLNVKIIVELKDLNIFLNHIDIPYELIVQINTVKELPHQALENLRKRFDIKQILVGQICYLSNYFLPFLKKMANEFNINPSDYLEIEKNVLISNDFYSIDDYKRVLKELKKLILETTDKNSEYKNFQIVYEKNC